MKTNKLIDIVVKINAELYPNGSDYPFGQLQVVVEREIRLRLVELGNFWANARHKLSEAIQPLAQM